MVDGVPRAAEAGVDSIRWLDLAATWARACSVAGPGFYIRVIGLPAVILIICMRAQPRIIIGMRWSGIRKREYIGLSSLSYCGRQNGGSGRGNLPEYGRVILQI